MAKTTKPWYKSKTLIVNGLLFVTTLTDILTPGTLIDLGITSKQFYGGIALLGTIANMILRLNTDVPIVAKKRVKVDTDNAT